MIELDPEFVAKAIAPYENELEPEKRALDAFYRQFVCLRCGSKCRREMARGHVFADPDTLVPRSLLRCERCGLLFDPHTAMVVEIRGAGGSPVRT